MNHRLVFATNNSHKLDEIKALLVDKFNILSLKDIGFEKDILETGNTFEENALIKSQTVFDFSSLNCFSDDSGLEVEYLEGKPGVYSARYAGEYATDKDNVNKLLTALKGVKNRNAQFKTVICLRFENQFHYFEGVVKGIISEDSRGMHGFGYDPVFIPNGFQNTFAELGPETKNKISHRAIAIQKLTDFINKNV